MENEKEKISSSNNFRNILILSIGSMFLMGAWLTTAGIEQTILQSVQVEDPSFTGDGYISQSIVNGVFAPTNFLAPTIVAFFGVRTSLVVMSSFYMLFVSSFLYPNVWLLYGSSACVGFVAASFWVANGVYFTRCSTKETIGKYMGIYWAIMSIGQLSGNSFVFWRFQGMNHIDRDTRFMVISMLTGCSLLASITFMFLGKPNYKKDKEVAPKSIISSITEPFRLLTNKHMLLLIPSSFYNGLELAFFTVLYPTSVAFTEAFGGDIRKLVGFAGILSGFGSLFSSLVLGVLVAKYFKANRTFIVTSACVLHILSFILMYLNISNAASLGPTLDTSWINPPSIPIAMLCAFILGIGDGCVSPQMCAAISVIWPEDPSSAFALYRFFLAVACAGGYFIGTLTGLHNQLIIFCVVAIIGTVTFRINEGLIAKRDEYPIESAVFDQEIAVWERKLSDK